MVQEFCLLCYDSATNLLREKNRQVLEKLNLPSSAENENALSKALTNFYQDHVNVIFHMTDDFYNSFCIQYKTNCTKILSHSYQNEDCNFLDDEDSEKFEDSNQLVQEEYTNHLESLMISEELRKLTTTYFSLCAYMLLNDPPLKVALDNFRNRKYIFKSFRKSEFLCIDGFAKEGASAIVILPPVMRNSQPYFGVKAAVLILPEKFLTEKVRKKVEEAEKELLARELKKRGDAVSLENCVTDFQIIKSKLIGDLSHQDNPFSQRETINNPSIENLDGTANVPRVSLDSQIAKVKVDLPLEKSNKKKAIFLEEFHKEVIENHDQELDEFHRSESKYCIHSTSKDQKFLEKSLLDSLQQKE